MIADSTVLGSWQDMVTEEFLHAFERASIPFYLVIAPDGPSIMLPHPNRIEAAVDPRDYIRAIEEAMSRKPSTPPARP